MAKLNGKTWLIASGLLLSMALPGCAHRTVEVAIDRPVPVAVPIDAPAPPAELTRCALRPAGLPEDAELIAQIPTRIRAAIIRIARAFGENANRQDRLINWNVPGTCPGAAP